MTDLLSGYDALILDADGVIYRGAEPVPHAIDALTAAGVHLPWCVVTNNAAHPPSVVAQRITDLGLSTQSSQVITSPQGAVEYLRERGLSADAVVLVVGGRGIDEALRDAGFHPTRERSESVRAVVQGFGPDVGWRELAEAGYAITSNEDVVWVSTNMDANIPTEFGFAPGNGALVGAIHHAIERWPDAVTGKPAPLLFELAASRMGATRPLVIGDRIDTDICGANRAGMDSLLVLTGVWGPDDVPVLAEATPEHRPTYLASDLRALTGPGELVRIAVDAPGDDSLAQARRQLARAWVDSG
jgi:glycerol 3-phosphatase-2